MPLRPSRKPVWTMPQHWLLLAGVIAIPSWHWAAVAHLWRSSVSSVAANRPRLPCYATVDWQPRTAWRKYVSRLQYRKSCQNNGFPRAKLARHLRYAVLGPGYPLPLDG